MWQSANNPFNTIPEKEAPSLVKQKGTKMVKKSKKKKAFQTAPKEAKNLVETIDLEREI